MDSPQYSVEYVVDGLKESSFKPYYKWIVLNTVIVGDKFAQRKKF